MASWTSGWMDGWMEEWQNGWMDGWLAGWLGNPTPKATVWERTEAIGRAEANGRRWRLGHVIGRKRNLRIETSDAAAAMSAAADVLNVLVEGPRGKVTPNCRLICRWLFTAFTDWLDWLTACLCHPQKTPPLPGILWKKKKNQNRKGVVVTHFIIICKQKQGAVQESCKFYGYLIQIFVELWGLAILISFS